VEGYQVRSFDCELGSHFHHGCVSEGPPIIPYGRISQVRFGTLAFPPWAFPAWRGLSAGSHTPHFRGLPIASFHLMRQLIASSVSGCRAADETTKCPESLCPMSILKLHRGDLPRSPPRTLLLGHRSYGLMRQSQVTLPYFGLSLVRGVFAGCYQPLLPPGPSRRYLCESFRRCLGPYHDGLQVAFACYFPCNIGLPPQGFQVGLP
jgi:hypothetical protein